MYANGAPGAQDARSAINSPQAPRRSSGTSTSSQAQGLPALGPDRRLARHRRGLRGGVTNSYIHNSGLLGGAEGLRKVGELATVRCPSPREEALLVLLLGDAHGLQGGRNATGAWKFMSWAMEPEPHYMYSKGLGLLPARRPSPSARSSRETRRSPASSKSFPFSIVSPYLAYAGWGASSTPRACRSSSSARRQAHGPGVPRQFRRGS